MRIDFLSGTEVVIRTQATRGDPVMVGPVSLYLTTLVSNCYHKNIENHKTTNTCIDLLSGTEVVIRTQATRGDPVTVEPSKFIAYHFGL